MQIAKKVQEMRSKWYGHVVKIEEHYKGMRAIEMKVGSTREKSKSREDGLRLRDAIRCPPVS